MQLCVHNESKIEFGWKARFAIRKIPSLVNDNLINNFLILHNTCENFVFFIEEKTLFEQFDDNNEFLWRKTS